MAVPKSVARARWWRKLKREAPDMIQVLGAIFLVMFIGQSLSKLSL